MKGSSLFKKYRDFITRRNIIDLAIAVMIGGAFGQVVNSLVADVLTPLFGAIGGRPDFSALKLGPIGIGKFINAIVNFFIVATGIYFLIVVPAEKIQTMLKKAEEEAPPPEPPEEVKLLREILSELKKRNTSAN